MKTFEKIPLGSFYEDSQVIVFFGNTFGHIQKVKNQFHNLMWVATNQVHGNKIVEQSIASKSNADGILLTEPNTGALIKTADCAPVFLHQKNTAIALHCGWRSIASGILTKALKLIDKRAETRIFIGPHIGKDSFEVQQDTIDIFKKIMPSNTDKDWVHTRENKTFIDLLKIIEIQTKGHEVQFLNLKQDTFSSKDYNSYRRDQTQERQFSFICLKN